MLRKALFPAAAGITGVFAATEADANANAGADYNLSWRAKDFLSRLGIAGVTIPGPNGSSYTSVSAFHPKLSGIVNKYSVGGTLGYLAVKFLPVPFKSYLRPITKGVAVGGAIGGLLDPAQVPSPGTYAGSAQPVSAYSGGVANPIQFGQS